MKKIISLAVAFIMTAAILIPASSYESYGAVSVRTSMPSYSSVEGKTYYYTNNNVFYKNDLAPNQKYLSSYKGYCTGNCTWYAFARASEMNGKWINSNFRWSASKWWDLNKQNNYYPYGTTPKVGAIACYDNHVAVVEKVVNGQPYVSESGWKTSSKKPTSASDIYFHYGKPWYSSPKGYIYV
ncbi:MAG: CHAP domain-containing protein, partial [Anaerovoracaceae bacterium]